MLSHSVSFLRNRTALLHSLVIVLFAAILCARCLLVGVPPVNDATIHVMLQYHFSHQFWSGDFYPRWLVGDNKGYGSPAFLIQYPLPFFITALLRPITAFPATPMREAHELGVYCFLVFAAAGIAARAWFRNRCSPLASTLAAVAYISLPYILGQGLYGRLALGELTAFIWMPLALALCDAPQRRLGVVSAIGIMFALLILSNVLCAILFAPVILLYAMVSGKRGDMSFVEGEEADGVDTPPPMRAKKPTASIPMRSEKVLPFLLQMAVARIAPVLFALVIGIGVAAVYLFPLVTYHYQRLFDINVLPTLHPEGEFGRYFLMSSVSDISNNRIYFPGMVGTICLTILISRYVWRADVSFVSRLVMLLTLGLGILMLIPDLGPRLIEVSGFKTSSFGSIMAYSLRMLFTSLFTLALGLLAYCRVAEADTDGRVRLLLLISCGAFILMLPWCAAIWKAIPQLAVFQYPWRLCAILTIAVAGLFAVATNDCLRRGVGNERTPSPIVMSAVVLAVIVGGSLVWRVDIQLLTLDVPRADVTRNVDFYYPTYVPAPRVARFAKLIGTSPDSFAVDPTPVQDGVSAEITSGQCDAATVVRLGPRKLHVSAQCQGNARLRIGQLYFPLWRIVPMTPGGETLGSSAEGLSEVSLVAGQHNFDLVFDGGLAERYGATVSLVSVLLVMGTSAFAALSKWGTLRAKPV
jgi:hypothetical protein